MTFEKWRIHPGHGTWLDCFVWETTEQMHDFVQQEREINWEKNYGACYLGKDWHFRDGDLVTRKLGEIHLVNGKFGAGIFAHELQHFLTCFVKYMGWTRGIMKKHWEDIAHLAGDLTREFWEEFYKVFEVGPGEV